MYMQLYFQSYNLPSFEQLILQQESYSGGKMSIVMFVMLKRYS